MQIYTYFELRDIKFYTLTYMSKLRVTLSLYLPTTVPTYEKVEV